MDRQNCGTRSRSPQRHGFSKVQLEILETTFLEHNYPNDEGKMKLVEETKLTKTQVTEWFKYRRKKEKATSNKGAAIDTNSSCIRRHGYSESQIETLEAAFLKNNVINKRSAELASATGLSKKQVRDWFENRRNRGCLTRPTYTKAQHDTLEAAFLVDKFARGDRKRDIAKATGLTEDQVRCWMDNRRQRLTRHKNLTEAHDGMAHALENVENYQQETGGNEFEVTPAQEVILKEMFEKHRWLNMGELADMMERTGLEEEQVKKWFKRQRELTEEKKEIKEEPEDEME